MHLVITTFSGFFFFFIVKQYFKLHQLSLQDTILNASKTNHDIIKCQSIVKITFYCGTNIKTALSFLNAQ